MFGSSEDRARQLAYRTRRERVVSSGSASTRRSVSSASRNSQHVNQASTTRSATPTDLSFQQIEPPHHDEQQVRPPDITSAHPGDSPPLQQHLQDDQHRRQSEYLSEVLYSSLPLASLPQSSDGLSPAALLSEFYKVLGSLPCGSHDTESVLQGGSIPLPDENPYGQPTVSLRGGAGPADSPQDENSSKLNTAMPFGSGPRRPPPDFMGSGPAMGGMGKPPQTGLFSVTPTMHGRSRPPPGFFDPGPTMSGPDQPAPPDPLPGFCGSTAAMIASGQLPPRGLLGPGPAMSGPGKPPQVGLFGVGPYQQLWPWPASSSIIVQPTMERERFMHSLHDWEQKRFTALFGPLLPCYDPQLRILRWQLCAALSPIIRAHLTNIVESDQSWNASFRNEELARLTEGMYGPPPGPSISWPGEQQILLSYLNNPGYSTLTKTLTMLHYLCRNSIC